MACKHAAEPTGYIAWHAWADAMSKTHRQKKCPDCRLYKVWIPKNDSDSSNDA